MRHLVETTKVSTEIYKIKRLPQVQYSLTEQLSDLTKVAVRLGLYDAADHLAKQISKTK